MPRPEPAIAIGSTRGRLRVLGKIPGRDSRGLRRVACRCECGQIATPVLQNIINGNTRSCGCLYRNSIGDRSRTHGESSKTVEYETWKHIKRRCFSKSDSCYHRYGGRGITMCERWSTSYDAFLHDMGRRPDDCTSIDRIDNNGNYEPGNCRWATPVQQARNTRSNTHLTIDGRTMCISEWCAERGIHYSTVKKRVRAGWSLVDAVSKPSRQHRTVK